MAIHWSVGSLGSEVSGGIPGSLSTRVRIAIAVDECLRAKGGVEHDEDDLSYWRAVSVSGTLAGVIRMEDDLGSDVIDTRNELVKWLETKEYLGDVLRVGMERGLSKIDDIKAILESDVPPSMSSGAL
jgi:hypothetical protein